MADLLCGSFRYWTRAILGVPSMPARQWGANSKRSSGMAAGCGKPGEHTFRKIVELSYAV